MSSLKQFDNVMETFEKEIDKLKKIGEVYAGVQNANKEQRNALQKLHDNNAALQGALKEARVFQDEIKGITSVLPEQAETLKTELKAEVSQLGESLKAALGEQFQAHSGKMDASATETLQKFQENNTVLEGILKQYQSFQVETRRLLAELDEKHAQAKLDLVTAVDTQLEGIRAEQGKFKQSFSENLEVLRADNRDFHKETQSSVGTKNEAHSAEMVKIVDKLGTKNEAHSAEIVKIVDKQRNTFKSIIESELTDRIAALETNQSKKLTMLMILNGVILLVAIVGMVMSMRGTGTPN
jgi:pyruvoyl-dependent arginine decarboxylase (PvlArgDC)